VGASNAATNFIANAPITNVSLISLHQGSATFNNPIAGNTNFSVSANGAVVFNANATGTGNFVCNGTLEVGSADAVLDYATFTIDGDIVANVDPKLTQGLNFQGTVDLSTATITINFPGSNYSDGEYVIISGSNVNLPDSSNITLGSINGFVPKVIATDYLAVDLVRINISNNLKILAKCKYLRN
jgi:hypothetical protein